MSGPPPKPTALKILQGNPGRRPLPKDEPKPANYLPPPPKHLNADAKKKWRQLTPRLVALGIATEIDADALAIYCQLWATWVEVEGKLAQFGMLTKTPNDMLIQSPFLGIRNRCVEQMVRLEQEFGMTPGSRSRVHAGVVTEATDPLSAFLAEGKG